MEDVRGDAEARVGSVLKGKWKLDRLIDVGGMGAVYAATHRNGKRTAVKLLHRSFADNENARTRFLREGYVANRVDHPGAVSVLDDDIADDGSPFLVMELLVGESVEDRMRRSGDRLDVATTLWIFDQALDVLAAAHAKKIVHRDLKPANLFLTSDGVVKVLDFGLAGIREQTPSTITQNGMTMGTAAFMPPEQARGRWEHVDSRSDLWAIGASMFRLLAGRYVHAAPSPQQRLITAMSKPAPKLASCAPEVPEPVAALIDRALAFEKDDRWQDAQSMQTALREASLQVSRAPAASAQPALAGAPASIPISYQPSTLDVSVAFDASSTLSTSVVVDLVDPAVKKLAREAASAKAASPIPSAAVDTLSMSDIVSEINVLSDDDLLSQGPATIDERRKPR